MYMVKFETVQKMYTTFPTLGLSIVNHFLAFLPVVIHAHSILSILFFLNPGREDSPYCPATCFIYLIMWVEMEHI